MSEIDVSGGDSGHKKGPGVKRTRKLSTRVDMTPMVDLGFLLITFFIFTTSLNQPKAMRLIMPDDAKDAKPNETPESGVLTILLGSGNSVFYFEGSLANDNSN